MLVEEGLYEDDSLETELEEVKRSLGINKPNSEMNDDEIKATIRGFGERGPDNTHGKNGQTIFGPKSVSDISCVTLYYFPKYYEKLEMSQPQ